MPPDAPVPGQRWLSDTEPGLGLGVLRACTRDHAEVHFPAADTVRRYAWASAPLRRAVFQPGERLTDRAGMDFTVTEVTSAAGRLLYHHAGGVVPEGALADTLTGAGPAERLLAGRVDDAAAWSVRVSCLQWRSLIRQSPVRGFAGGRVDLIPHQLSIAAEVCSRLHPRVLLADEVGLGKTIEAALILHRLHLTGRADRILVLVPGALVHQWFVEMLRRFSLLFSLFDEERCAALTEHHPETNPFLDSQLVLCSTDFLTTHPHRAAQATEAGWAVLAVDEAHHLTWSPGDPGPDYAMVEALAARIPALLLLTATPEQTGTDGHFARLRLLDPARYQDAAAFAAESALYGTVAEAVDRVRAGSTLTDADRALFAAQSPGVSGLADAIPSGGAEARAALVEALLDEFGTGRVMFRNTRQELTGFPERRLHLCPLGPEPDVSAFDRKTAWLAGLLRSLGEAKVLLICRTASLTAALQEALLTHLPVNSALFHEDFTLLQRDRNAAFFAQPDGAQVLLCSEIGSEGRNFQFARHLVLFDLPDHPELLEQRIGRLDRIGQRGAVEIHVPYLTGSPEEVLARWFHEGLDAFRAPARAAATTLAEVASDLAAALTDPTRVPALLERTRAVAAALRSRLALGQDRLLALRSCQPERAAGLITTIRKQEADPAFERFVLRLLDHLGMHREELEPHTWHFRPENLITDTLPGMPEEGLTGTFARSAALAREDRAFLTPDHPLVRGAIDWILSGPEGNAFFAVWRGAPSAGLWLEALVPVECIAPAALHADRFLSAAPLRIVVDHHGQEVKDARVPAAALHPGDLRALLQDAGTTLLPGMLAAIRTRAEAAARQRIHDALHAMENTLLPEIRRLEDLRLRNPAVRPDEIEGLRHHHAVLTTALSAARPRLDTLRLIARVAG